MPKSPLHFFKRLQRQSQLWTESAKETPRRLDEITQLLMEQQREIRTLYNSLGLPPAEQWLRQPPRQAGAPGTKVFTACSPCRQDSFSEPYFSYWTTELREALRYHRKLWEFVFICQALHERGMLANGRRGLGFGVGEEPLSAYFAAKGCQIVATDIDLEYAQAMGWTDTNQHATGLEALRNPLLCADDVFNANVTFETCDMNQVPDHLTGFDFCWSACALEHLGSIEHGLAFIERSVETLKPGGWAIHTTEFNTGSNEETIDHTGTVLFRRRDFAELALRLAKKGHRLAPLDFNLGDGAIDRYIDVPPYREQPHLAMMLSGFPTTSYGLIVQRGPA